jgi:hypothetical protein
MYFFDLTYSGFYVDEFYAKIDSMANVVSPQLKINWFHVQVPNTELSVYALSAKECGDFKAFRNVRQYNRQHDWLAVCVGTGSLPPNFSPQKINIYDIPSLTSSLISEAILEYFSQRGFNFQRGKGQISVFRKRPVDGLPNSLTFYEGLLLKPFYIPDDKIYSYGVVIDYITHQEFTASLANDAVQRTLAKSGHELLITRTDGTHFSGRVVDILDSEAVISSRDDREKISLSLLRVKASYQAVRDYFEHIRSGQSRAIIRSLQVESLSLIKSGFTNVNRLRNRYERVATLLERSKASSINITLPTECKTIISLATEPADLELTNT